MGAFLSCSAGSSPAAALSIVLALLVVTPATRLAVASAGVPAATTVDERCGRPLGNTVTVVSDCLVVLQAATRLTPCAACICDLDGSGTVTATDGQICVMSAVGLDAPRDCPPCSGPCPDRAALVLHAGTGAACSIDADCTAGVCDPALGRCSTATEFQWGFGGAFHTGDLEDRTPWSLALDCDRAGPACGPCAVTGLDPAAGNCRCSTDNRARCGAPFGPDPVACDTGVACEMDADCNVCSSSHELTCTQDDDCPDSEDCLIGFRQPTCTAGRCAGECTCYEGPPLPVSGDSFPLCLLHRFTAHPTGTVDVDRGSWELDIPVREERFVGELQTASCPVCGGSCTEPAATRDRPCLFDEDCDPDTGPGDGRCERFDVTPGDGARDGTCVFGDDHGAPCDVQAVHGTFPAPGGGGHSLDCLPANGRKIAAFGVHDDRHVTTGDAALPFAVECGFGFAPVACPCGSCSDDRLTLCSSNSDCAGLGECDNPSNSVLPNLCPDRDCAPGPPGAGQCTSPIVERFCDAVLRASGEPLIACRDDFDCQFSFCGPGDCGLCTLERPIRCFADPVGVSGRADPHAPVWASLECSGTISTTIADLAGLPAPARTLREVRSKFLCDGEPPRTYRPGPAGCTPDVTTPAFRNRR